MTASGAQCRDTSTNWVRHGIVYYAGIRRLVVGFKNVLISIWIFLFYALFYEASFQDYRDSFHKLCVLMVINNKKAYVDSNFWFEQL